MAKSKRLSSETSWLTCWFEWGGNLIESVITRRSAAELKLKKGDSVSAVVKATEVMILKD